MRTAEERKALVQALVGERVWLYQQSVEFHAAIHVLADLLPYWIDGLAADAEVKNTAMSRRMVEMRDDVFNRFAPKFIVAPEDLR